MRAVIIDDEDHVRENLKQIIHTNFNQVHIVGEGHSVVSAVQVIKDKAPDLIFLDIDLSDGSGFNVLEQVQGADFNVIFVTAYNSYAIKAFRYNALDYILKPINIAELGEAINKATDKAQGAPLSSAALNTLIENLGKKEEDRKLVIRNSSAITYVKIKDIVRCEGDGNYTTIYLIDKERVVASRPLKEYVALLPEHIFFRVHQSHLINLHYVKQFTKVDGEFVVMEDDAKIAIARRRKEAFFEQLERVIS